MEQWAGSKTFIANAPIGLGLPLVSFKLIQIAQYKILPSNEPGAVQFDPVPGMEVALPGVVEPSSWTSQFRFQGLQFSLEDTTNI